MSNRETILAWFVERLSGILVADEYATNAGQAVHLGEIVELGKDDPDVVIAVVINEDSPGYQGESTLIQLPIEFQATAKADLDAPYLIVEQVLADIKRAVEVPGRRVAGGAVKTRLERGPTRVVQREPGSDVVGVGVTYIVPYVEPWGQP
jgi:hypothetical protein